MNRIEQAIASAEKTVITALGDNKTTKERVAGLHKMLDLDAGEYVRFQVLKTAAVGISLTPAEAQTIYGYLGGSMAHFNKQRLAVKAVLTHVFMELLKRNMGQVRDAVNADPVPRSAGVKGGA